MTKKRIEPDEIVPWELKALPVAPAGANPADTDLKKIIRKSYRTPIVYPDPVSVEINGRPHQVCDISSHGLGLIVPPFGGFLAGSLHDIILHVDQKTLYLQGTVTHVSSLETPGECLCGIKFIDLNQKDEHTLQQFLAAHRTRLFGETSHPADLGRD